MELINKKKELLEYCKKYNENVIEATMEELKEKGYFDQKIYIYKEY